MPEMLDDIAYLSQEVGPRPAGTEEEQQAALYIAEQLQKRTGFTANIEDFSCASSAGLIEPICFGIPALFALLAMINGMFAIPALLASLVCAVLFLLEVLDKPVLSRAMERGVSQNVVARYVPGTSSSPRSRKIIIVAGYDSGKVRRELSGAMGGVWPILRKGSIIALCALVVIWLLRSLFFADGVGGIAQILNLLNAVCVVLTALPAVLFFVNRAGAYNEAANHNASGVAVMMRVAQRIAGGMLSEEELQQRKDQENEDGQGAQASSPESTGRIHGEEAVRAAGLVPEGVEIEYSPEAQQAAQAGRAPEAPEPAPAVETEADRLASAKGAIAALTGRPIREYAPEPRPEAFETPEDQEFFNQEDFEYDENADYGEYSYQEGDELAYDQNGELREASAFVPVAGAAVPQPEFVAPAVPAAYDLDDQGGVGIEEPRAEFAEQQGRYAGTYRAQDTRATAYITGGVPDWYRSAQEKARHVEDNRPVRRSRYADALESAIETSTHHFAEANAVVSREAEDRLTQLREEISSVEPPTLEDVESRLAMEDAAAVFGAQDFTPVPVPEAELEREVVDRVDALQALREDVEHAEEETLQDAVPAEAFPQDVILSETAQAPKDLSDEPAVAEWPAAWRVDEPAPEIEPIPEPAPAGEVEALPELDAQPEAEVVRETVEEFAAEAEVPEAVAESDHETFDRVDALQSLREDVEGEAELEVESEPAVEVEPEPEAIAAEPVQEAQEEKPYEPWVSAFFDHPEAADEQEQDATEEEPLAEYDTRPRRERAKSEEEAPVSAVEAIGEKISGWGTNIANRFSQWRAQRESEQDYGYEDNYEENYEGVYGQSDEDTYAQVDEDSYTQTDEQAAWIDEQVDEQPAEEPEPTYGIEPPGGVYPPYNPLMEDAVTHAGQEVEPAPEHIEEEVAWFLDEQQPEPEPEAEPEPSPCHPERSEGSLDAEPAADEPEVEPEPEVYTDYAPQAEPAWQQPEEAWYQDDQQQGYSYDQDDEAQPETYEDDEYADFQPAEYGEPRTEGSFAERISQGWARLKEAAASRREEFESRAENWNAEREAKDQEPEGPSSFEEAYGYDGTDWPEEPEYEQPQTWDQQHQVYEDEPSHYESVPEEEAQAAPLFEMPESDQITSDKEDDGAAVSPMFEPQRPAPELYEVESQSEPYVEGDAWAAHSFEDQQDQQDAWPSTYQHTVEDEGEAGHDEPAPQDATEGGQWEEAWRADGFGSQEPEPRSIFQSLKGLVSRIIPERTDENYEDYEDYEDSHYGGEELEAYDEEPEAPEEETVYTYEAQAADEQPSEPGMEQESEEVAMPEPGPWSRAIPMTVADDGPEPEPEPEPEPAADSPDVILSETKGLPDEPQETVFMGGSAPDMTTSMPPIDVSSLREKARRAREAAHGFFQTQDEPFEDLEPQFVPEPVETSESEPEFEPAGVSVEEQEPKPVSRAKHGSIPEIQVSEAKKDEAVDFSQVAELPERGSHRKQPTAARSSIADIPTVGLEPRQQPAPLADDLSSRRLESGRIPRIDLSTGAPLAAGAPTPPAAPATAEAAEFAEMAENKRAALRDSLPSLSGAFGALDTDNETVSKTGSFAPVGATGAFAPVGDELVAELDPNDIYVDDADDSDYEDHHTQTGAFAGPGYVEMPESRTSRFFGRFRKRDSEETSMSGWLDVDENFNPTEVGKERGGWESFAEGSDYKPRTRKTDDYDDGDDWNGGAFGPDSAVQRNNAKIAEEVRMVYSFRNPDVNTEVWFVALGSEQAANGGMRAFMREHAQELRGSIIINLESMGAGHLSYVAKEGIFQTRKPSTRLKRYLRKAAEATGLHLDDATIDWRESPATLALRSGLQGMTIAGMDGSIPADMNQGDDVVENIDEQQLNQAVEFVLEVVKSV